jgi:hypothetical protein
MNAPNIEDILQRLHILQSELETEIEKVLSEKRELFQYTLERGRVRFEQSVIALQRKHKQGTWNYILNARLSHLLSAPVVYSLIVPFIFLDAVISFYQHVCFRIYGIERVPRAPYFVIDRQKLAYLNFIEKFNCVYCDYGNGLIEYAREITARTEQYWCPIKHARRSPDPHRLVDKFVDYGDVKAYKDQLQDIRKEVATLKHN